MKTVAISYYPAQNLSYRWTDQDRGLMLAALKLMALFNGLATTLQVDELDKLTNAFGKFDARARGCCSAAWLWGALTGSVARLPVAM